LSTRVVTQSVFVQATVERRSTQLHISVFICIYPGQKILPG
jgi:hypothetical protein